MAKEKEATAEVEVKEPAEVAVDPAAKPEKASKPAVTEHTVVWPGGSRVFSKEVHGEAFADNAKEFAAKHKGEIQK